MRGVTTRKPPTRSDVTDGLLGYNAFLYSDGVVTVMSILGVVLIGHLIRGTGSKDSLLRWAAEHAHYSEPSEAIRVALIARQIAPLLYLAYMWWMWIARPTSVHDPDVEGLIVIGMTGVLLAWGRWRAGRDSPPVVGMPRWFRNDPSCWHQAAPDVVVDDVH